MLARIHVTTLVVAKRHQLRATQTFEPPEVLEFFGVRTADVQSPLVPIKRRTLKRGTVTPPCMALEIGKSLLTHECRGFPTIFKLALCFKIQHPDILRRG